MELKRTVQAALDRAQVKRDIKRLLDASALPKTECSNLLAELLADESDEQVAPKAPIGSGSGSTNGSTNGAAKAGTKSPTALKLLAELEVRPRAPISDLATKVYGVNTKQTRNKIRSWAASLKRAGRLHQPAGARPGQWEVVPK